MRLRAVRFAIRVRVPHCACPSRGFSATSIRAAQRPQRRVGGSARVARPVTKLGVPLSSPLASHIRKEPDKLVGWEVLLEQGGARSGQVQSILGGPLSSTLLRVYGPGWGSSATQQMLPAPEFGDSGSNGNSIHLIPLAEGIVHRVDVQGRRLFIKPPEGLLELSQRRMLLEWLDSQLEELAAEMANPRDLQAGRRPYMPTREQLKDSGNSHLIPAIQSAGGFLEVAFELNFRHRRRPSGYWDNMDTLDQEISRFVASNWVELSDIYSDTAYFYNQITGRVCETEPTLPTVETSGDYESMTWTIKEDPNDRVMPSAREVCSAGRYDLHHGIVYNGGYRAVALELHRPPSYPRAKPQSLEELAEELMAIMEEEELGDRVPTPSLLYDIGKQHLLKTVYDMGGFPTVVELMSQELGMEVRTRRRAGHWDDIENVVREMREFMEARSGHHAKADAAGDESLKDLAGQQHEKQHEKDRQQFLPTHRELMAAGRPDLRYALQKHGHTEISRELGVAVNPRGRPRKSRPEPSDSEDVKEEGKESNKECRCRK